MRHLMLGIAVAVTSLMPSFGMADDQQIANFIKSHLQTYQQQGQLRGFNVDMRVEEGTVWFSGHVSKPEQARLILETAQQAGHLGVKQVVDDIEVRGGEDAQRASLQAASFQQALPGNSTDNSSRRLTSQNVNLPSQQSNQPMPFANASAAVPINSEYETGAPMMGAPMMGAPMAAGMAGMGGMAGSNMESPNLPGYAWPGYAAHPNYGAVNYPKQYSPSAWPYIGPFYPYPQVPLGWRKVSLQWDDGWWWLDFHDK